MLALGQLRTLLIMPSGLHKRGTSIGRALVVTWQNPLPPSSYVGGHHEYCCCQASCSDVKGLRPAIGMQRVLQEKPAAPDEGSIMLGGPHGGRLGDLQHIHSGSSQAGIRTPALALGRVAPVLHTERLGICCAFPHTSQANEKWCAGV